MSRLSLCFVLLLGLLASTAGGQTVTIYNNFGPDYGGWSYVTNFGWSVAGPNCAPIQFGIEQAFGFKSNQDGVVSDIWVAIFFMASDPQYDEVTIRLARNPDGLPPTYGDVMEEWTITVFPECGNWAPPQQLVGKGTSLLQKGESYWLWAEGGDTTWCGWSMNDKWNLLCSHTYRIENSSWIDVEMATASAFRVDVKVDYGLAADKYVLSESTGGTVTFDLFAGSEHAKRDYVLCASMSGTSPGTLLPGGLATLPLNWDTFSRYVLKNANTPVFQDFMGTLSANDGSAQAVLDTQGPLPAGFAGKTLYFAYAVGEPWDHASVPVAIDIVP